jgi:putative solute:sodium symporter small subunit
MEIEEIRRRQQYWRQVCRLTLALLSVWLLVTLLVPWYARDLSHWSIGHFPFDYWMSAQGAIMLYVLLIVVYAEVMDRLDRRWHALHAPDSLSPSELSRLHD